MRPSSFAQEIAECSPLGLISTRAAVRAGLDDRVLAATNHRFVEQNQLLATEDFKEGVKATAERRVTNLRGRSYVSTSFRDIASSDEPGIPKVMALDFPMSRSRGTSSR